MKFYLKKLPTGRVYLSQVTPKDSETVLQEIDAEMWIRAREKVNAPNIYHNPGYGFEHLT